MTPMQHGELEGFDRKSKSWDWYTSSFGCYLRFDFCLLIRHRSVGEQASIRMNVSLSIAKERHSSVLYTRVSSSERHTVSSLSDSACVCSSVAMSTSHLVITTGSLVFVWQPSFTCFDAQYKTWEMVGSMSFRSYFTENMQIHKMRSQQMWPCYCIRYTVCQWYYLQKIAERGWWKKKFKWDFFLLTFVCIYRGFLLSQDRLVWLTRNNN